VTDEMLSISTDNAVEDELPNLVSDDFVAEPEGESFWRRWLGRLWPTVEQRRDQHIQRLHDLDVAIAGYPETPGNYVLRGEIYLELGEFELAVADFSRGLAYASAQVEYDDWGLISQSMQDRAEVGLEQAQQRLNRQVGEAADSGVFE
jgi:hypothetical protein